jgi:hypothetical protein
MVKAFQRLIVTALCLLAFVLGSELLTQIWPGVHLVPSVQAQDAEETGSIYVYRQPKNVTDPVQITKITEGGNEIVQGVFRKPPYETPGQPIPGSDDWIENLSISFKNLTSLKIEFMHITMSFYYGEDRDDLRHAVGWALDLGQVPAVAVKSYYPKGNVPPGTGHPLEFGPGQEMTIPLADLADKIKAKIVAKTPFSSATRCVIGVAFAYFDQPGLMWGNYGMGWTLPDPDSPNGKKTLPIFFFPGDRSHPTEDRVPPHNGQASGSN